jgi:hypothetical protein
LVHCTKLQSSGSVKRFPGGIRNFNVMAVTACGERFEGMSGDAGAPVALLDQAAWRPVSAEEDALAAHRPAEVSCPKGTYLEEGGALEPQTGY